MRTATGRVETPVEVRLARDDEGERVRELVKHSGFVFDGLEFDWSRIHPFWLLAFEKQSGRAVGTVQVCPGRPVGRLEILSVDPEAPPRVIAYAVRQLLLAGRLTLRSWGAQAVSGLCPDSEPGYLRVLEGMGAVILDEGTIVLSLLGGVE